VILQERKTVARAGDTFLVSPAYLLPCRVWLISNVYCSPRLRIAEDLPWQMDRLRRRALRWQAEVGGGAYAGVASMTTCGRCAPRPCMSADGIEEL
jgi:hypothetical protein